MLPKCQVSSLSSSASWYMPNLLIHLVWRMQVTELWCCHAGTNTGFETYRERIDHLLLPVHRFQEPQVADYPSWGQTKDRSVLIQGYLHHGVFGLQTERCTKRDMLPWRLGCFICSSKAASVGTEKTHHAAHFDLTKS